MRCLFFAFSNFENEAKPTRYDTLFHSTFYADFIFDIQFTVSSFRWSDRGSYEVYCFLHLSIYFVGS